MGEGETWHYRVVAIDESFNRSAPSAVGLRHRRAADRHARRSPSPCRPRPTPPGGPCTSPASSTGSTAACPQWNPGGRRPDPRRRHPLDDHPHRQGGHPDRVQVRARLLGLRREGRRLRRGRQPAADPQLRRDRHPGRQRHRRELAQRGSLRELTSRTAGRAAGQPAVRPVLACPVALPSRADVAAAWYTRAERRFRSSRECPPGRRQSRRRAWPHAPSPQMRTPAR